MKVKKIKLREYGRFQREREVNLDELGQAKLVALVGDNGQGKSTFMESVPGVLYRSTPSHDHIAYLSTGKNTVVEVEFELDHVYRAQLQIDGLLKSPKVVQYMFKDGEPLTDGLARSYCQVVSDVFPTQEALLSAAYAAQNGQGRFLSLQPAERKALFAQMLGLGKLEEMSKEAGEKARSIESELAVVQANLVRARMDSKELPSIGANLRVSESAIASLQEDIKRSVDDAGKATAAIEAWRAERADIDKLVLIAQQDYRSAKQEFSHIENEIYRAETSMMKLESDLRHYAEIQSEKCSHVKVAQGEAAARELLSSLVDKSRGLSEARDAAKEEMYQWSATLHKAMNDVDGLEIDLSRALKSAGELKEVPCGGNDKYSGCPLIKSAVESRESAEKLRTELAMARAALDEIEASRPKPFDVGALNELEDKIHDAEKKVREIDVAIMKVKALGDIDGMISAAQQELSEAEGLGNKLSLEKEKYLDIVDKAHAEESAARGMLDKHLSNRPQDVDRELLDTLMEEEKKKLSEISALRVHLENAREAQAEEHRLALQEDSLISDIDDWRHLQKALGKNGVQALEIDAAGPDVSDIANELLHACYGTRFSVSLETTALKADGKGSKEVFELHVIDTERGTEGDARHLSGGEQVLVSEALSLAIAIYNTQRSDKPMLDLWRDECSGALSGENARRYIEMLRRAVDLGGFHRCYFVAHQEQLWEMADRRIVFAGGKVEIQEGD